MTKDRHEGPPPDPSGIEKAHDVLAAEEFAMPVGRPPGEGRRGFDLRAILPVAAVALAAVLLARLRRR